MTKTHAIEFETSMLLFLAAVAGVFLAFYFNHAPKIRTIFNVPVMMGLVSPTPTPPLQPQITTVSELSPNGAKKITMTVTPKKTSKTYLFTVSSTDGSSPQTIYSVNVPNAESMAIPFNAFSPNNTYVFLQHNTNSGNEAFVFRSDGNPVMEGVPYFDAKEIFAARATGNTYQTATGWASDTLVIINTTLQDSSKGPSYWLEIPSKAVIQLSTQF